MTDEEIRTSVGVYQRLDGLWDWRMMGANGEIIATSGGQGFTERNDAVEAVTRVLAASLDSTIRFDVEARDADQE